MADNTSTSTQTVRLAPFQEQFLGDIFSSASALTGDGSQMPYSAQQRAGLSTGQQDAITATNQGI